MPGRREAFDWIKTHSAGLLLALIIAGAASLSLYWVFLVPVFQSPDEPAHLDYAFNIYSARRLISAREPCHRWNAAPPAKPWHVYTEYLIANTGSRAMFWHFEVKAPAGYGTREFYDRLDNGAPSENVETMEGVSKEMLGQSNYTAVYPFGYYAAVAAWM